MWRPENWENIKTLSEVKYGGREFCWSFSDFEAGADAMLEVIREGGHIRGVSLRNIKDAIGWAGLDPKSKWYCIPEDE